MRQQRHTLRGQAGWRVGMALLVAALASAMIAFVVHQATFDRVLRDRGTAIVGDFEVKLRQIERGWEEQLGRERVRLEFTRLLENPATRWDRLRAYLAAQADAATHSGLTLCNAGGRVLFRQGPVISCVHPDPRPGEDHGHHYLTDEAGNLFITLDAPIWLGPDGMGRMYLAISLDHAFLWTHAFPGTELLIEWQGRFLASSAGESGLQQARASMVEPPPSFFGRRHDRLSLPLPGTGDDVPRLHVRLQVDPPFSATESLGLAISVFALFALLITQAIQGWLNLLLRRIESLMRGARLYAVDGRPSVALEQLLTKADGGEDDELSGVVLATRDMVAALTTRDQQRDEAEARLRLADKVFQNSAQAIIITDAEGAILSVNPAFSVITGYLAEEAVGQNPRKFSSGRHGRDFYAQMWHALKSQGTWSGEVWDRRKNGEVYPKWLAISAVQEGESGNVSHYVGIFSDITEQKENAARIEHLAYHDPLTGLPNRFALNARLDQTIADARRNEVALAVMFIDLDRFKTINDSLGHNIGDLLLVEVAHRLRSALRETDTVARLGGDEFVVVVTDAQGPEDVARVAEKLIAQVGEPMLLAGHVLHTSPSIGVALFPSDGGDRDSLMKNADAAMYYAKQHGRNNFHFFAAEMNATASRRLLMETQMRGALDRDEFFLVFQPQVEIATGRPVGVEALVRWRHPERGLLLPEEFIPLAEETGLIIPLGAWVLESACRHACAWRADGLMPVRLAVNLSAYQLKDRNLVPHVAATLARTGLPPELLELEVTESVVMESPERAIEILSSLQALGVHLAIDDFGIGYSSLAYLRRLPNSRLKIDRSFVMDLESDANDVAITEGIIALARSLGLPVTAEGIETPAQLDLLKHFGCGEGQGFLFARPLSDEALRGYLAPLASAISASGAADADPTGHRLH